MANAWGWPLCEDHVRDWYTSPESERCTGFEAEPGAETRRLEDEEPRWRVALQDWLTRAEAERRNGGQT